MKIYHYTTSAGILGIFDKKHANGFINLRLSNISQMNDEAEYLDGISVIKSIIEGMRIEFPLDQDAHNRLDSTLSSYYENGPHGTSNGMDYIYSCSFSEAGDDIGQWRGYTSKNNGYCIEFDKELLVERLNEIDKRLNLSKCIYDRLEKEEWAKWLLGELIDQRMPQPFKFNEDETLALATKVRLMLSIIKNKSFKSEHEWRIISPSTNLENVFCMEYGGAIKSFTSLQLPASVVTGVRISPTKNFDERASALRILFKRLRLDNLAVRQSEIPFRYDF